MLDKFTTLEIWTQVKDQLEWYYQVSINNKPAKFLICKRIKIESNLPLDELSTDQLWVLHNKATEDFLQLWQKVKDDQVHLSSIQIESPNLLDLNKEIVNRMLESCNFCTWNCKVDRKKVNIDPTAKSGTCQLGTESRVSSFFHHRGEELIYRGTNGSGTIFFTSCSMRCKFCQNGDISSDKYNGLPVTNNELANMMILLRLEGVHNINFVGGDPSIHLHSIIDSINALDKPELDKKAVLNISKIKADFYSGTIYSQNKQNALYGDEFNVPMLWNSNFFGSTDSLRILRVLMDVWLPDFKFGPDKKCATRLSRTPWYFDTVSKNIQTIDEWGENYSIRHLVMPNHVECCSVPILDWIKENTPNALINIMGQYHPDMQADPYSPQYDEKLLDISRRVTRDEMKKVFTKAEELNLDFREVSYY
jgi:putative pyruvate formate lyase activating enzyme